MGSCQGEESVLFLFETGHTTAKCLRKKECSKRNGDGTTCKRPHPKLLHTRETSGPVQVNSLQDKSKTLLPVITGAVKAPSADVPTEASIFFDSGTQISMVRSSFAESLGLESKTVKILITKVGGVEEELSTKLYKVCSRWQYSASNPSCRHPSDIRRS